MRQAIRFDNRRRLLITAAVATVVVAKVGEGRRVGAAELPLLPASHPQAMALGYSADAASSGRKAAEHQCATCSQFRPTDAADGTGTCTIFPGHRVAAGGWCRAFSPRG